MKFRNNLTTWRKHLKQLRLSVRISSFDIVTIEIDIPREFYMLTILNFTFKNR